MPGEFLAFAFLRASIVSLEPDEPRKTWHPASRPFDLSNPRKNSRFRGSEPFLAGREQVVTQPPMDRDLKWGSRMQRFLSAEHLNKFLFQTISLELY